MSEGFPRDNLLAEPLWGTVSVQMWEGGNQQLTPIVFCKSLFEYVLMTLTATSRPRYSPFHTSANPPLHNATPVRS